jgi:hypothetical protein
MKRIFNIKRFKIYFLISVFGFSFFNINLAQNPIILDQFTADPCARVFGDRVYVYPSHDILAKKGQGRAGWFCMEDYHVFSSANLTDWTDHGIIVSQNKVKWADSTAYSMWAPDCIFKNGKYYFFFPAQPNDTAYGRGFSIGVSVSEKPAGPFTTLSTPIKKIHGIDPNPFIDKDGQAYLYWAMGRIYVAKLKENMTELASEPRAISGLPDKGLIEGPFLFERNGIYYLTYPHVSNTIERLEYATADNPMGPYEFKGVIMDESPTGCWTNQPSVIKFRDQWYLFYHQNDLSPKFDKNRSVRIDSLFFNADGTIRKVIPTLRGVGQTDASKQIQIDRYSCMSNTGVNIAFIDTLNTFRGWKTVFTAKNAWIQYNSVDFSKGRYKKVNIRALSNDGGVLILRLNDENGPVVARAVIPKGTLWIDTSVPLSKISRGIHNIIVQLEQGQNIEADWVSFNK